MWWRGVWPRYGAALQTVLSCLHPHCVNSLPFDGKCFYQFPITYDSRKPSKMYCYSLIIWLHTLLSMHVLITVIRRSHSRSGNIVCRVHNLLNLWETCFGFVNLVIVFCLERSVSNEYVFPCPDNVEGASAPEHAFRVGLPGPRHANTGGCTFVNVWLS